MNEDEDLFCPPSRTTEDQIEEMRRVAAFGVAVVILFVVSLVAFAVVYAMRAFT
jgi:hypothetical protein